MAERALRRKQEQGGKPVIRIPKAKSAAIATFGVDIGKNTFDLVGLDDGASVVLSQGRSRAQVEVRLANMTPCLVVMEACVGAYHFGRRIEALGLQVQGRPGHRSVGGCRPIE
jgi:hypothetical protein